MVGGGRVELSEYLILTLKAAMTQSTRKYLIAGNWKMNRTSADAQTLAGEIVAEEGRQTEVQVVLCPPFTALEGVSRVVEGTNIALGAQNMHPKPAGAYTGEVSAPMLRGLFCGYVILGHSERRTLFGETDEFVNAKVLAALESALKPILCVGETLQERDAGNTLAVVSRQLRAGLAGVAPEKAAEVVIAYEPVWAIGTGRNATPEQAQEVHAFIRAELGAILGASGAGRVRILYGGSMKADNAAGLLAQADIDGGLIGGASLEARSFLKIVEAARQQAGA